MQERGKAVFAWSMALVELVAWKGEEEGASEEVCKAAVQEALKTNVYIGIFLSNLDVRTLCASQASLSPARAHLHGRCASAATLHAACPQSCMERRLQALTVKRTCGLRAVLHARDRSHPRTRHLRATRRVCGRGACLHELGRWLLDGL